MVSVKAYRTVADQHRFTWLLYDGDCAGCNQTLNEDVPRGDRPTGAGADADSAWLGWHNYYVSYGAGLTLALPQIYNRDAAVSWYLLARFANHPQAIARQGPAANGSEVVPLAPKKLLFRGALTQYKACTQSDAKRAECNRAKTFYTPAQGWQDLHDALNDPTKGLSQFGVSLTTQLSQPKVTTDVRWYERA